MHDSSIRKVNEGKWLPTKARLEFSIQTANPLHVYLMLVRLVRFVRLLPCVSEAEGPKRR